jgi:molybdenum cofactor cytidylyltransferase
MIAGIILAAGEGIRIGKPKLNLSLGSKRVIEWVLEAALSSLLDKIILVIRPDDKEVLEIGKRWKAEIVFNPDFKKGMSTTIQKGLLQLDSQGKKVDGFCLILGDQPLINAKIINQLITSFTKGKKEIVVPYYQDKRGNPVLFDLDWKEELMNITGDVGGRVLIKAHPDKVKRINISDSSILFDIDREEDYLKARTYFERKENSIGE